MFGVKYVYYGQFKVAGVVSELGARKDEPSVFLGA